MNGSDKQADEKRFYEKLRNALYRQQERNRSRKLFKQGESSLPIVFQSVDRPENKYNGLKECLEQGWTEPEKHLMLEGIGGIGKTTALLNTAVSMDIPVIYIPLCIWARDVCGESSDNLIRTYIKDLFGNSKDYAWLESEMKKDWEEKPSILLILDGVNELSEKNRERIAAEIDQIDENYPGVQMILSSRYDFTPEIRSICIKIKMMPLNRENIAKYLADQNICLPKETSKLWKIIDTPFMLELYAAVENKKSEDSAEPHKVQNSETAGGIIKAYLKKEIERYHKNNKEKELYARCTISVYAIAPYVAYQMLKENAFVISYEELIDYIEEACDWHKQNLENGHIPKTIKNQPRLNTKTVIDSKDIRRILEESICLFYLLENPESEENTVHLIHQHFRDCLAAIHLCNTAEMLTEDAKGIPKEWNLSFDRYVMGFLADLLEKPSWNNVWEAGRKMEKTPAEFTNKMLELYKQAYGNNISDVNFRGMDLTEVPLFGFCLNRCHAEKQNSNIQKNERKFAGAVIGGRTISGEGHTMDVTAVSWRRSDQNDQSSQSVFMSASHDCTIRIWDIKKKSSGVLPRKHANYIRCAEWSPADADRMASAGDNKELICWEEENENKWNSRILATLDDWIYGLSWSPDGKRIACGERSGQVSVIDLQGRLINFSRKHKEYVRRLSWSPDNSGIFASGSDEGTVCLWNADSEEVVKEPLIQLELYGKRITGLAWLENGKYLLISDTDCYMILDTAKLLSCGGQQEVSLSKREELLIKKEKRKNISAAAVQRKSEKDFAAVFYEESVEIFYTTCIGDGNIEVISIDTAEWSQETVSSSQWNAKCSRLICGCDNGEICLVDVKAGEMDKDRIDIKKIVDGCGCSVRCTDWAKDGKRLAAGYDDQRVRIWNVSERKCLAVLDGHRESIKSIAWSPDNSLLASGDNASGLRVWDMSSLEKGSVRLLEEKSFGTGGINAVIWLDQNRILCGSDDSMLYLWDRTEQPEHAVHQMPAHEKRVYGLALSPDKKFTVSVGNDRLICLWDMRKLACVQKTDSFHEDAIRDVSWFPDGSGIATGSNDRTVICRQFDNESKRFTDAYFRLPKKHDNFIYSVACTGNNRYIVSGSTDSRVGFWDRENETLHSIGEEHGDFVWDVSAGPETDGRYYTASASSDGMIKIWDVTDLTDESIHSCCTLKVIPGINLVGCDFSGAIFQTGAEREDELRELILVNGGRIDELSEEELREYREEREKELQRTGGSSENAVNIYTEEELDKSIRRALTDVQGEKLFYGADEDDINRDIYRALSTKGYHAKEQASAGKGKGGKNAGELDILVEDENELPWAIIEGIKLEYLDRNNLKDHIDKIVDSNRYNPFGCRYGNLLIYYMTSSKAPSDTFARFCSRFRDYLNDYNYDQIHLTDLKEEKCRFESYILSGKIEFEIGDMILHFYVFHIQNS